MNDIEKTKEQLVEELAILRKKISETNGDTDEMAKTNEKCKMEKRIKVSEANFKLSIAIILVIGSILPISGSMFLSYYLKDMHWVGIPAHSVLETLGSFTGLLLSLLILSLQRAKKIPDYYIWVSCGLIALGIFDGFDAFAAIGQTSLRLHNISILIAGFLFLMVWFSDRVNISKLENKLPSLVAFIAIFLGFLTIYSTDRTSTLSGENIYTFIGGILFLSTAVYFIKIYRIEHDVEDFIFTIFSLLYGWAGIFFSISTEWNADWWFWHILRLAAYFVIMSYMFIRFQKSEEKLLEQSALLDCAHDAIEVMDLNNRVLYWNKGAERLYGFTTEDVLDKNTDGLLCKYNHEKESLKFAQAKKSVIEKGEWSGELCRTTKNNKDVIVDSSWSLIRDNNGKPKSILVINTNITDKKRLESQFLRAQRLESIGTLAGGIAHDLNNVMTPIMLSIEMLKEKFTDESSQRLVSMIERNAQRGTNLIKQVVSFAKGVEGERMPLQISQIINEIKKIIRDTFPKDIEINIKTSGDLPTILGDTTQIQQVLMNLCVNARDAMPNGGVLNISAEHIIITDSIKYMNVDAKNGPYVVITVSDTGTGIPTEIIDKIFDPFFTTKDKSKGTGLGLSIAMSIIRGHGGFINVESIPGKGTTFNVYLPAVKDEIPEAGSEIHESCEGAGESILLVDDECAIKEITSTSLERHGYKVITADDGAEAVTIHSQNKGKINVIVMDMMMPIMDGQDSIKRIRKIDHDVKIIAVSGAADKDKFGKISGNDVQAFLPKPYTVDKLLSTIKDVISKDR